MASAATLSPLFTPDTTLLMHTHPYQPSESGSTSASAHSIDPMDLVVIRKRSRSPSLAPSSSADDHDTSADLDLDLELEEELKSHGRKSSERSLSPSASRKPMRKRAKTQEEKETRAQERIMRNRLAAQTSRQRKREYVTTMEQENTKLKTRLSSVARENKTLKADMQVLHSRLESMEQMFRFLTAPGTTTSIFEEQVRGASPGMETLLDVPPPNDHLLTPNNILSHFSHASPEALSAGEEAYSLLSPEQRIPAVNVDQQRHSVTQTARTSLLLQRLAQCRPRLLRQMSHCLLQMAQMATLQKTFKQHSLLLFSTILFKQTLPALHCWMPRSNQPSSQPRSHTLLPSGPPGARFISAATEGQQAANVLAQAQCVLVLCAAHLADASHKGSVEAELTRFQQARDMEDLSAAVRERQQ